MRIDIGILAFLFVARLLGVVADDYEHYYFNNLQNDSRMLQQLDIFERKSNSTRRRSKRECVVIMFEVQYADHRSIDEPLACELLGDDLNGKSYSLVRVKGLTSRWARKNNVISGVSTIVAVDGAAIDDQTNELTISSGSTITVGRHRKESKGVATASSNTMAMDPSDVFWTRNLVTSVRTVIVMRIVARDSATTATEAQLADKIFGASGDVVNLKSRYYECSDGQMQMQPLTSNSRIGTDGVYTINLPNYDVVGADAQTVIGVALSAAQASLGVHPKDIANHVIMCMPPLTAGNWLAFASINYWQSAYNDDWCTYPSALMHETGHNLGLDHAGEGTSEYGDQSGMMGSSYSEDEAPIMCFNAANNWQLGWYANFRVDLPISSSFVWSGSLVAFAEKASAAASDRMTIRIRSTVDYYIHFNRQIGINSGTREGVNKVIVTSRASGLGPAKSTMLAKLVGRQNYSFPILDALMRNLTIYVNTLNTATVPSRANVTITFEVPTPSPTRAPTLTPTDAPTASPTRAPTSAPTASPTRTPTSAPTATPTRTPTSAPTASPTRSPTSTPTASPTSAPTAHPTESPTFAPTAHPTESPTFAPTASPTGTPTAHPVIPTTPAPVAPSLSPTIVPSEAPSTTAAPSGSPSETPTLAPTTGAPTTAPTDSPTGTPTNAPTIAPTPELTLPPTEGPTTLAPTVNTEGPPTKSPTRAPTVAPTALPTRTPTNAPTIAPTATPTKVPTKSPTTVPTSTPTGTPTKTPTSAPTKAPTVAPTATPTKTPTKTPTTASTNAPTVAPTEVPTNAPTSTPTAIPTTAPTSTPTAIPTEAPTMAPTKAPTEVSTTKAPTSVPTKAPTKAPTKPPTKAPTKAPTKKPTKTPTKAPTKAPTKPFCNKNGTCEPGENCVSCPNDCRGGFSGNDITSPDCCIGGACASRCTTTTGWKCT